MSDLPAPSHVSTPPAGWTALWRGEAYRILFPVGIALGVWGLLLWPAFVYKFSPFYPGLIHARLMIEGFVACFVIGFLGTAMPRMLEVPAWSRFTTAGFAAALTGIAALHARNAHRLGDLGFAVVLLVMMLLLALRFPKRKDLPPPGFCLVILGLLCGAAGALLLALGKGLFLYSLGKLLLYQGFPLLPVLGIGTYLLPRMLGLTNRQLLPGTTRPTPEWTRRALTYAAAGGLMLLGFVFEALGWVRTGWILRAVVFSVAFLSQVPLWRMGPLRGSLSRWLPVPFVCIPLGYVLMSLFPDQRMDLLHFVMVGGFGLLIPLVATRVALGHGGGVNLIFDRWHSVNWMGGLAVLALFTRISAPWLRKGPFSHYAYAAITLAVVFLIWLIRFLPYLQTPTPEDPS